MTDFGSRALSLVQGISIPLHASLPRGLFPVPPVAPRISPPSVVSGSPLQVGNSGAHREGLALTLDRAALQSSASPAVGILE